MSSLDRRSKTERKIKQRERMMKNFGLNEGTTFAKHRAKVRKSAGYMKDGNVSHFVSVRASKKTKVSGHRRWSGPSYKRAFYRAKFNYSVHDERQVSKMDEELKECEKLEKSPCGTMVECLDCHHYGRPEDCRWLEDPYEDDYEDEEDDDSEQ